MSTYFIVQTASASMPRSCWGKYKRVAVLEVPVGVVKASAISERAKDVVRIVETWDRLSVGKTSRCAYAKALAEAQVLADSLNSQRPAPVAQAVTP